MVVLLKMHMKVEHGHRQLPTGTWRDMTRSTHPNTQCLKPVLTGAEYLHSGTVVNQWVAPPWGLGARMGQTIRLRRGFLSRRRHRISWRLPEGSLQVRSINNQEIACGGVGIDEAGLHWQAGDGLDDPGEAVGDIVAVAGQSRTPLLSRPAKMRNPSCLIS
jgi:hypothetical protein